MALSIEYLIVVQKEDDFCKDAAAFINFIAVDTTIKPSTNTITDLATNLPITYTLTCGEISNKKERFFNLKMVCKDDDRYEHFNMLARKIKKVALKINHGNTEINTLHGYSGDADPHSGY